MAKNAQARKESKEIRALANKLAQQQKFPGQTKEHNKLIAQGIHKGIEQFLRQQSERTRELDKKSKKLDKQQAQLSESELQDKAHSKAANKAPGQTPAESFSWLPWGLLAASWLGFIGYYFLFLAR